MPFLKRRLRPISVFFVLTFLLFLYLFIDEGHSSASSFVRSLVFTGMFYVLVECPPMWESRRP